MLAQTPALKKEGLQTNAQFSFAVDSQRPDCGVDGFLASFCIYLSTKKEKMNQSYQVHQHHYRSIRYFIIDGDGCTLLLAGAYLPFAFRFQSSWEATTKARETIDNFWSRFS